MTTQQPEALRLAAYLRQFKSPQQHEAAAALEWLQSENEQLRAGYDAARLEIASLQAQLEAVGGVGPLLPAEQENLQCDHSCDACAALQPAAQARQPLTDAEITMIYFEALGAQRIQDASLISRIARAVEEKHGIAAKQGGV